MMQKNEIKETIKNKLIENFSVDSKIKYDDNLSDFGIDSIKIIELVVEIEETFDFEFDDEYLTYETLKNIDNITRYIETNVFCTKNENY